MARDEARQKLIARYLDGEVTPEEASQAERLLDEDPALAEEIFAVKGLGTLLRNEVEEVASRVDFTGFADRVLAEAQAQKKPSLWERIEEFFRERFGKASQLWLPGAVVAAAALAGLLLSRPHEPEGSKPESGPQNELVITKVDTDKDWMSQTIDDQGTTILWIDDSQAQQQE